MSRQKIKVLIDGEEITVVEMAKRLGVSRQYIARRKNYEGETYQEISDSVRIHGKRRARPNYFVPTDSAMKMFHDAWCGQREDSE